MKVAYPTTLRHLDTHSYIDLWLLLLIQNIKTNNAVQFESFQINSRYYIAMANHGSSNDYEVDSTIYQMFENGSVSHYQDISTKAASDVKFFRPQGSSDSYLIFANMKDNTGNTAVLSKVSYLLCLRCVGLRCGAVQCDVSGVMWYGVVCSYRNYSCIL